MMKTRRMTRTTTKRTVMILDRFPALQDVHQSIDGVQQRRHHMESAPPVLSASTLAFFSVITHSA